MNSFVVGADDGFSFNPARKLDRLHPLFSQIDRRIKFVTRKEKRMFRAGRLGLAPMIFGTLIGFYLKYFEAQRKILKRNWPRADTEDVLPRALPVDTY
jgi:hypothetical protein